MHIVPIAWMFVVLLMAVTEATSTQGTVLGAIFTFLLYGLLPLSIVMYLLGTPGRRQARKRAEAAQATVTATEPAGGPAAFRAADTAAVGPVVPSAADGDGRRHAPRAGRAAEREEP